MMTTVCPTCRHLFPEPGCCNMPRYMDFSSSFSTDDESCSSPKGYASRTNLWHSGGCVIQNTKAAIVLPRPSFPIRSKLTGGGCLLQKSFSEDFDYPLTVLEDCSHLRLMNEPSGCQELPGIRRIGSSDPFRKSLPSYRKNRISYQRPVKPACNSLCQVASAKDKYCRKTDERLDSNKESSFSLTSDGDLQIHVNATFKVPSTSVGQCTLNITASAATTQVTIPPTRNNFNGGGIVHSVTPNYNDPVSVIPVSDCNDFVSDSNDSTPDAIEWIPDYHDFLLPRLKDVSVGTCNVSDPNRRDVVPNIPLSWIMPRSSKMTTLLLDNDNPARLEEVKRLLQMTGWYYPDITGPQSEDLLNPTSIGKWLLRDSSDSRYTFAVTIRSDFGLTSVRVHFCGGKFRLDSTPHLEPEMPLFECPIKMLDYYVRYSKRTDRNRVWMNCHTQFYSQIYLTEPLVKETRSLCHLARLAINKNQTPTDHLPPLIRSYLAEYPYSF